MARTPKTRARGKRKASQALDETNGSQNAIKDSQEINTSSTSTATSRSSTPRSNVIPRENVPQLELPHGSMYVKIEDIDPHKVRYHIHGRVEKRTELIVSQKKRMMMFHFIIADQTAEIKISVFGEVANRYDSIIKEGTWYVMNNFRVQKNSGKMNYTIHKYEASLQKFSVVEERPNEVLMRMPRHFYIKPSRDIFKLLNEDVDGELIKPSQENGRLYTAYDLEAIVFKVKEGEFKFNGRMNPKVEFWVTNGEDVIMISILGERVLEFKNMFNPNTWQKLIKGISSVRADQFKKLNVFFRNVSSNHYRKFSLQLQSKAGEMYLKPDTPNYIVPMIPRHMINYSQTFLEIPGNPDDVERLEDIIEEEGTYVVKAKLIIGEMELFSYPGIPGDVSRRKVTIQPDGRYYCASNETYYTKCEEFYRFDLTLRDFDTAITALIFDRAARKYFGKSADELMKLKRENPGNYETFMKSKNNTQVFVLLDVKFDESSTALQQRLIYVVEDIIPISQEDESSVQLQEEEEHNENNFSLADDNIVPEMHEEENKDSEENEIEFTQAQ